jgi:hypothetical protein
MPLPAATLQLTCALAHSPAGMSGAPGTNCGAPLPPPCQPQGTAVPMPRCAQTPGGAPDACGAAERCNTHTTRKCWGHAQGATPTAAVRALQHCCGATRCTSLQQCSKPQGTAGQRGCRPPQGVAVLRGCSKLQGTAVLQGVMPATWYGSTAGMQPAASQGAAGLRACQVLHRAAAILRAGLTSTAGVQQAAGLSSTAVLQRATQGTTEVLLCCNDTVPRYGCAATCYIVRYCNTAEMHHVPYKPIQPQSPPCQGRTFCTTPARYSTRLVVQPHCCPGPLVPRPALKQHLRVPAKHSSGSLAQLRRAPGHAAAAQGMLRARTRPRPALPGWSGAVAQTSQARPCCGTRSGRGSSAAASTRRAAPGTRRSRRGTVRG